MTQMFGPAGISWGANPGEIRYLTAEDHEIVLEHEGELTPETTEHLPTEMDLGDGFKLVLAPDAFHRIMHSTYATEVVRRRCQELTEAANSLAVVDGAEYLYRVSDNAANERARGRVYPGNDEAHHDNARYSTLLKALAQAGSDPKPLPAEDGIGTEGGEYVLTVGSFGGDE
jgi:hypothetical protein